jgi:hypothetical protein
MLARPADVTPLTLPATIHRYRLPLDVADAGTTLKSARLPVSVALARSYLVASYDYVRLLALYQHYFPQEWADSSARPWLEDGEGWSPREAEFVHLVADRLFPVAWWEMETVDDDEDYGDEDDTSSGGGARPRRMDILIEPQGLDWYEDRESQRPAWQGLLVLTGELQRMNTHLRHSQSDLVTRLQTLAAQQPSWATLGLACATLESPLRALPDAIQMIRHDTGSVWLDATLDDIYNGGFDAMWSRADVDWLHADYVQAQEIEAAVTPLLAWLEADPTHWEEVCALWTSCVTPPPPADLSAPS